MLTRKQHEHISELALIVAVPKLILDIDKKRIKKSRMQGILDRLTKHSIREIKKTPPPDVRYCEKRLIRFFSSVQWTENSKIDVIVLISFILGVIEESETEYPQSIIDALNDAFEWISQLNVDGDINDHLIKAEEAVALWKGRTFEDQRNLAA